VTGFATIGDVAGGTGTNSVSVSGSFSTWLETGNLAVGRGGQASFAVANRGTLIDGGDLYIGFSGSAPGTGTATGTVTISSGATASVGGPYGVILGERTGDSGTLTITDAGTKVTVSPGGFAVGDFGVGTLTIEQQATATAAFLNVGTAGPSPGSDTASILSSASLLTNTARIGGGLLIDDADYTDTGSLMVGSPALGAAVVTVQNAGSLASAGATIGANGGASPDDGEVRVDGATWTSSGAVTIGDGGTGTLTLTNDAVFDASSATVGNAGYGTLAVESGSGATLGALAVASAAGGSGRVLVDAAQLDVTGDAVIGSAGSGTLLLTNAGTVTVGGTLRAGDLLGATGSIQADGTHALLSVVTGAVIGNAGSADATFDQSASFTIGGMLVEGQASTGDGTLTTSDLATVSANAGTIGEAGAGGLNLHTFSSMTFANGLVFGDQIDATGTASVDGSATLRAGSLIIGNEGNGDVFVNNLGVLQVDQTLTVAVGGTGLLSVNNATVNAGAISVGIDGLAQGHVDAQSGAIIFDQGAFALSNGGSLSLEGGSVTAASYTIDGISEISGYGTLSGAVSNAGLLVAGLGGTLRVLGAISGAGTNDIAGGATLSVESSVSSTSTIDFIGSSGLLKISKPKMMQGRIADFGTGDAIDLVNTPANLIAYSTATNRISVYNQTGTNVAFVTSLQLVGNNAGGAFSVQSDGAGGSLILAGSGAPDPATMCDLAGDTYSATPSQSLDGFSAFDSVTDGKSFVGVAYRNGNQIVVAFRGTVPTEYKDLLKDASFASGVPSAALRPTIAAAAAFLNKIQTGNPGSTVSVTGHSLGGAIAQLVGVAAGDRTIVFDAPGAYELAPQLTTELAPAAALNPGGVAAQSTNYRLIGDQVSQIGTADGVVISVASPFPRAWLNGLDNHGFAPLAAQLRAGAAQTNGIPDPPLPGLVALNDAGGAAIRAGAIDAGVVVVNNYFPKTKIAVDPGGASEYSLDDTAGSIPLSTLGLPDIPALGDTPGVASWRVDLNEIDGSTQTLTVAPGTEITGALDFTAADFTPLDLNGDPVVVAPFVFTLSSDQFGTLSTQLDEEQCYAAGTAILTASGLRPVERLRRGDRVAVRGADGAIAFAPIRWTGMRHVTLDGHPRDAMVRPVRIRADAVAPGVPARDLVVSPDHAVRVAGVLVQARRLVNGMTVEQDVHARTVSYHHVALDWHALLIAEGLEAESYLRAPGQPGAMTLATAAEAARAWATLAARARALGYTPKPDALDWTDDPVPHLEIAGRIVRPVRQGRGRYLFHVPPDARLARLRSRAARPTDRRPWLDDRRLLGLQVSRLIVHGPDGPRPVPLDGPMAEGWHAPETRDGVSRRWTDGDAVLPDLAGIVAVEIVAGAS
jgi:T5SS/PEP-CTERM-associated repeat protein